MRAIRMSAAVVAMLAAGCSLILTTADPEQCASDSDCDANPSLRGRKCDQGFCVVPKLPVGQVSNDAGAGCITTKGCTQQNSNQASVCKVAGGPCTPWQTEICPIISGPWDDPNVLVVGSILPLHVRQADGNLAENPYAERVRLAIDLGLGEVNKKQPFGMLLGQSHRPLAVLHCESAFDPTYTQQAITHLTDVVGAPIVILGGDVELIAAMPKAQEKGTALVCSDCAAPLPPGNTAWRVIPSLALQAPLVSWRVNDLQSSIGPDIKVAVLTEPGLPEDAFVDAFTRALTFNGGKTVAQNGAAFTVEKQEDALKKPVLYDNHIDALVAFEPDILVVAMGQEFTLHYLDMLELKWHGTKPKPYYVITDLLYDNVAFAPSLGKPASDALRARISGTRTVYDKALQDNIDGFSLRYQQENNFKKPGGNFSGYDAFYASMYGIAGASVQTVLDGPHISLGFERLRSGTVIDFGPDGLDLGLALLLQPTSTIDVRGLITNLDWDPTTHDLITDSSMFCFHLDTGGELTITPDAGPRYVRSSGTVTGTYSCN
jgi:hypothetical protein